VGVYACFTVLLFLARILFAITLWNAVSTPHNGDYGGCFPDHGIENLAGFLFGKTGEREPARATFPGFPAVGGILRLLRDGWSICFRATPARAAGRGAPLGGRPGVGLSGAHPRGPEPGEFWRDPSDLRRGIPAGRGWHSAKRDRNRIVGASPRGGGAASLTGPVCWSHSGASPRAGLRMRARSPCSASNGSSPRGGGGRRCSTHGSSPRGAGQSRSNIASCSRSSGHSRAGRERRAGARSNAETMGHPGGPGRWFCAPDDGRSARVTPAAGGTRPVGSWSALPRSRDIPAPGGAGAAGRDKRSGVSGATPSRAGVSS